MRHKLSFILIFLFLGFSALKIQAQYFKAITPLQAQKFLNPAYVLDDSSINFSILRYESNFSNRNLGQTIVINFGNNQSQYVQENRRVADITSTQFSLPFKLTNTIKSGFMLSHERERFDVHLDRDIISLSNAYEFKVDEGYFGIGVSLNAYIDRSSSIFFKDEDGVIYGSYLVHENYLNNSLGLSYKTIDKKFKLGFSVNNLFKKNYSSLPMSTKNGPFAPMTYTFVTIDNRRTFVLNAANTMRLGRNSYLLNDITANKIESGIDPTLPSFKASFQLKTVYNWKTLELGLHYFNTNKLDDSGGGLLLGVKFLGCYFNYSYRLFLNRMSIVSGGEHQFGLRICK